MKNFIRLLFISLTGLWIGSLSGCSESESDLFGSISGIVTDEETREPLKGVTISLTPSGETKVTGSDGSYTFQELGPEEYTVTFKKDGYETDTKKINVQAGVSSKADMTLAKLQPVLSLSSRLLDFGAEYTTLTLDITNTGKGVLQWNISEDIEWLECTPIQGKTEKEVSSVVVSVSREYCERGDYSRTFAVASNGGSEVVTVNMSVNGSNLDVSPKEVDLGETESSIQLTLSNKGNGTISYRVTPSNDWMGLSKTSGKVTTKDYITLTVNRGSMAPGEYSGQLRFEVEDDVVSVPVKLLVSAKSTPVVSFDAVKNIAYNGATLEGTIVQTGYSKVVRYGFCWSEEPGASLDNHFTDMGGCFGPMSFTGMITNLTADTKYYVRAYAENSEGIAYSNEEAFITAGVPVVPVVQTNEVTDVKSTTATANGFLSSLGNVTVVSQHGHVWGTVEKPDISLTTKTELGTLEEPKAFVSELTGLNPNQAYYVRAYATNEKGTAYGEAVKFTTTASDMKLSTGEVTDIVHNAATCTGSVTDYGGRTIRECGVCWSTREESVSLSEQSMTGQNSNGQWTCRMEGLVKETTYYVRSYAKTC